MREQDDRGRTPSSPTGRIPQWVHDEMAQALAPPDPWRSWSPREPRRRKRRNWSTIGGAALVVCIVGLGLVGAHFGVLPGGASVAGASPAPAMPSPGGNSSDDPLGTPMTPPAGGGSYAFVQHQDDGVTPVAYDPCRPVHYVVRPDNAPPGGETVIQSAVARMSQVTGLQFVDDGATDEDPTGQREAFQPDRYGDRWAPVLISWETVTEQPDFAADVAGLGGSQAVSAGDGPHVYVTGTVELDAADLTDFMTWPNGAAIARAIVLHELGHVVGLDHVVDPQQLMYASTSDVLDFAGGDLTGLAQLGAGSCEPQL
ncbi:matrixin family metalloprotease [Modestobacter excelsi]|uniref:matrixin family metalloprotease n=1 Tax=Modestobacter excelsi TaxID=2213161 RepID=UPI001FEC3C7D|nr:matrixin family metalloprotease [Modestobacter excelsi]